MQVCTSALTRQKEDLRKTVAICQAITFDAKIIVMDEPIAASSVAAIT